MSKAPTKDQTDKDLGDNTGTEDLAAQLLADQAAEKAEAAKEEAAEAKADLDDIQKQLADAKSEIAKLSKQTPTTAKAKGPVKPKMVKILLEENDDIPPTGLYVGLNGKGFLIPTGADVMVPEGVVDILEHAVTSVPMIDPQTRQVTSYRDRMKYPFRKL